MRGPPIYLDNHATTRVDSRVVAAMLPCFEAAFGNPSSRLHGFGQAAADAVERARAEVAAIIGAREDEIIFTSGATESNRIAIEEAASRRERPHFVVSAIEHKSVHDGAGPRLTKVRCGASGIVDPDAVRAAIVPDTALVSVMAANNEIGTLQPTAAIGARCREAGVPFHCDATAAVGRVPIDVRAAGVDYLSFSGHKIYGPKGIGVLFARRAPGSRAPARPGTLNVPGIVGLATALKLCVEEGEAEQARLLALRNRLLERLRAEVDGVSVNGDPTRRLAGNLNVTIAGIDGPSLLVSLGPLAVSSGSACSTGPVEPSHVLVAIGRSRAAALASVRFGIGRFNTAEEIDRAAMIVADAVRRLRGASTRPRVESDQVLGNT